jgi:hypothetical protein
MVRRHHVVRTVGAAQATPALPLSSEGVPCPAAYRTRPQGDRFKRDVAPPHGALRERRAETAVTSTNDSGSQQHAIDRGGKVPNDLFYVALDNRTGSATCMMGAASASPVSGRGAALRLEVAAARCRSPTTEARAWRSSP